MGGKGILLEMNRYMGFWTAAFRIEGVSGFRYHRQQGAVAMANDLV
jgi:hypothetical protein